MIPISKISKSLGSEIRFHKMFLSKSRITTLKIRHKAFPIVSSSFSTMTSKQIPKWATLDPEALGVDPNLHRVLNIVGGKWSGDTKSMMDIPNPMDRDAPALCSIPDTNVDELEPFVNSLKGVTKSGVHNPLKNVQRYLMYGEISRRVSSHDFKVLLCVYCHFESHNRRAVL